MPKFVTRANANGEMQRIPAAWTEDGHPFADQFRTTPSQRQREERTETPSENWTVPQLREHAERVGIDLTGATTKADVLSAINDAAPSADLEG